MGVIDDNCVLDCYRLARYYHVDPRVFLQMSMSEIAVHLRWTIKLAKIMQDESSSGDD